MKQFIIDYDTGSENLDEIHYKNEHYLDSLLSEKEYEEDSVGENSNHHSCNLAQFNESILDLELSKDILNEVVNKKIQILKNKEAEILNRRADDESTENFKSNNFIDKKTAKPKNENMVSIENDSTLNKFKNYKKMCFKNLEAQILRLKDLDEVIDKLYQNYVNSGSL